MADACRHGRPAGPRNGRPLLDVRDPGLLLSGQRCLASTLAISARIGAGLAQLQFGRARLVINETTSLRRGSTTSDVPVKPVWPNVVGDDSAPMNHGCASVTPSPWLAGRPGRSGSTAGRPALWLVSI